MERQAETDNDGQSEGGSVTHALWQAPPRGQPAVSDGGRAEVVGKGA